jgi:hypothetical protein
MEEKIRRRTITIGPFSAYFTNINTTMRLPGHTHFATVTLHYETIGKTGFPAFATTYAAVQQHIEELTARPFRDMTNEDVADTLWNAFASWSHPELEKFGGAFALRRLELAVRGAPDKIGHADGFTIYTVEAAEQRSA